jgi:hypothetical protein
MRSPAAHSRGFRRGRQASSCCLISARYSSSWLFMPSPLVATRRAGETVGGSSSAVETVPTFLIRGGSSGFRVGFAASHDTVIPASRFGMLS